MNNKNYVLFDLDGTILASKEGIIKGLKKSLEIHNINYDKNIDFDKFIGPPLDYSFRTYLGMNDKTIKEVIDTFRTYYEEVGYKESYIFDGIIDLFDTIKAFNKKIVLATSKPENSAIKILEYFNIKKYFYFIAGAIDGFKRSEKIDVMKYAMENLKVSVDECVMIGDTIYDINAATSLGMDSIAVTYGYGDNNSLIEAKPSIIVDKAMDIKNSLML